MYLSFFLSVCLSIECIYLPICQSVYLSICLCICLSICLSVCLSIYLSVCRSVCLPASLNTKLFCETSVIFEVDHIKNETVFELDNFKNEAIQREFEVDNIKNEAIPRDFLQKWNVDCRADGLVPMRFAIFSAPSVQRIR